MRISSTPQRPWRRSRRRHPGATTRTCAGSSPSAPASPAGPGAASASQSQAVSRPSATAAAARARLERARRHPLADAACPRRRRRSRRRGASSCSGEPTRAGDVRAGVREEEHLVLRRVLRVDDDRKRVVVDVTSSAASAPVARSSLTTTATISPTKRTTSFATRGRLISGSMPGSGGGPNGAGSTSAPVKTCTPGSSAAAASRRSVDARVREHRAHERDRERVLEREVLDVVALPAEEARVLLPQHAVAEDAHGASLSSASPGEVETSVR